MLVYPISFMGGESEPTVTTFFRSYYSEANTTIYGVTTGEDDTTVNRYIVTAFFGYSASGANSMPTATIGGVSADVLINRPSGDSSAYYGMFGRHVPAGQNGDVIITFASTQTRCAAVSWQIENVRTASAFDTVSAASSTSGNIDVAAGGSVIAFHGGTTIDNYSYTWTAPTEDLDSVAVANVRSVSYSGASADYEFADTNKAISCTPSGTNTNTIFMAVSMR